jgi:hypothetical protein
MINYDVLKGTKGPLLLKGRDTVRLDLPGGSLSKERTTAVSLH